MSEDKHHNDTWGDSDKLKHQLINESRHRDMAGKIIFNLMFIIAVIVVCITVWLYWFE